MKACLPGRERHYYGRKETRTHDRCLHCGKPKPKHNGEKQKRDIITISDVIGNRAEAQRKVVCVACGHRTDPIKRRKPRGHRHGGSSVVIECPKCRDGPLMPILVVKK